MFDFMNDQAPDEGLTVELDPALEADPPPPQGQTALRPGNGQRGWKPT